MSHDPRPRGRFAPSPTGPLHLGSLVAALGSWMMARQRGGDWLVRIEDLDPPREVPGAADAQLATLVAFGLVPDGDVLRQSQRGPAYADALAQLRRAGHAFECRCSRSALAAVGGIHRSCVGDAGAAERAPSIRLRLPDRRLGFDDAVQGRFEHNLAEAVGDVVLHRADGLWAYQLAVVVDDAAQGITDVVRGADLLDSTPRQIYLQQCLGLPTPRYAHLPLLLDEDGNKLGKSLQALPVQGSDPWPALRAAWRFLGQDEAAMPASGGVERALRQALAHFDPACIPQAPAAPVRRTAGAA